MWNRGVSAALIVQFCANNYVYKFSWNRKKDRINFFSCSYLSAKFNQIKSLLFMINDLGWNASKLLPAELPTEQTAESWPLRKTFHMMIIIFNHFTLGTFV